MKYGKQYSSKEVWGILKVCVCLFMLWIKVEIVSILCNIKRKSISEYVICSSFLGTKARISYGDSEA